LITGYLVVILELARRRVLHWNVTEHPTADWTTQQFREALPGDHAYRFLIHDRDSIFSRELDNTSAMGVKVLRTPVRAPKANLVCERFGGTLRRECLDFLIPFNERHLKAILKQWVAPLQPWQAAHESWAGNTCTVARTCARKRSPTSYSCGPCNST
jgi:transposase InsO family protein